MGRLLSMSTEPNPTKARGDGAETLDPRHDFAAMVRAHQGALFYFILSFVGDRHRAEDLTQEVFLVAYRRRGDLREGAQAAAWLFGIARNIIMAEQRRSRRRPLPLDQQTLEAVADAFVKAQSSSRHTPGWLAGIEDCLGRLDGKNRRLVHLRYREQMSVDQIAESTGLGMSALKMRFMRLRQRLAECLGRRRVEGKP